MSDNRDHRHTPPSTNAGSAGLVRLGDLDEYEVADGFPDPRGWDVTSRDGRKLGKVKSLLVDLRACAVRFLEVELDEDLGRAPRDRCVHVPIRAARLDDDRDDVRLDLDAAGVLGLGTVDPGAPVEPKDHVTDSASFLGRHATGQ